ncbi:putative lipoprotein [Myxococcus hansupus]|uniref:Putative lipoprotein n=1 Tax=Pseudomyxococcus hansupus TaxID=1297742 RepID=A0A0H4WZ40_9BACT|nr:hypothetical protein [Myxococcus hansupus]AKQ66620.1 putative lipoprotein [Myxococcus hansupus]
MSLIRAVCTVSVLVSSTLSSVALAAEPPEEAGPPPQLSVEVGGTLATMRHPATEVPTIRSQVRTVNARRSAARLSGGLHFNLVRGSDRSDWWWTNGIDWYLAGGDVQVLALRPGLEKRFTLTRSLTLGVSAFGSAAEASLPTGRVNALRPGDPGYRPVGGNNLYEGRMRKWAFGAGGLVALQLQLSRLVHARVHGGYTHYFREADGLRSTAEAEPFTVRLNGPFAGALVGLML